MRNLLVLLALTVSLFAQDDVNEKGGRPWEFGVDASALASLNTYSKSWAGTEQASFAWNLRFVGDIDKQFVKHFRWENNLLIEYGRSRFQPAATVGGEERPDWEDWGVAADEIDFKTIGVFTMQRLVDPYVNMRVQSTFHNNNLSNTNVQYFNWVRLSESAGARMELLKKDENQMAKFHVGLASYQNIDRKVDVYNDFGMEIVGDYAITIKEDILKYTTYVNIYKAFATGENREDISGDKWKAADIEWKNELAVNVTKYLMFKYTNQLLYDREVSEKARFKQYMSMGVSFARDNEARKAYKAAQE